MGIGVDATLLPGVGTGGVASTRAGASVGADALISATIDPVFRVAKGVTADMNMCVGENHAMNTVAAVTLCTDASARVATGTDARTDAGAAAGAGAVEGASTDP